VIESSDIRHLTHNHVENASRDSNLFIGSYGEFDMVDTILESREGYNHLQDLRTENRELMNDVDNFTDEALHVLDNGEYCSYRWVESRLKKAKQLVDQVEDNIQEVKSNDVDLFLYNEDVKEGAQNYIEDARKGIEAIHREAMNRYGIMDADIRESNQKAAAD